MVEIYADVVFLINWVMNFFIFCLTGMIVRKKPKKWRLALGSGVSALLFCLLIFLPVISRYYNFFSSLIVLLSGILIAFGFKDLKDLGKLTVFAHISAFAVGGVGSAIFFYSNMGNLIGNMVGFSVNYFSLRILIAAICISYIIIKLILAALSKIAIKKQAIYTIKIISGKQSAVFSALVDTGNSLVDPVSKSPVIIAEFEHIYEFLPEKMRELFISRQEDDLSLIIAAVSGDEFEKSIRMIPFKSLGNENGMLIGFKPDTVEITKENKVLKLYDVVVGIYNLNLTKNGDYQGLLNPCVLEAE
ncbi:MAG: sigma-E processing peptidase SpoIIGA [Defluviitaleaceae bacterium]|nr:sigma-E processing peptidase SpoIIGA [Defluviitaleaceae bacterium]